MHVECCNSMRVSRDVKFVKSTSKLTFNAGIIFLNLAHPVYKMWIIREPNTIELWNKVYFEGKKAEIIYHV